MPDAGDHFDKLDALLDLEREAEKENARRELETLSVPMRESLGRTATRLTIDGTETGEGGYTRVILSRAPKGEILSPFHGMGQGDNVRLSFPAGTVPPRVDGTLDRVDEFRASVAVDGRLPSPLPDGRCMLDLLGSDATYRRMKKALQTAARLKSEDALAFREVLIGNAKPRPSGPLPKIGFYDEGLNKWQRDAVRRSLAAREVSIVHGPPGTGKTTVLVEIIRQAVARGERVLASAPSNVAVDNILEKLMPHARGGGGSLRVVRMGHPARIIESLRHGTLRVQAAADEQFKEVEEMDAWRDRLVKRLARPANTRSGLSGEERELALRETHKLWRDARRLELAIGRRLVLSAQVVLSTHGGISSRLLRGAFDLVALDEGSQATEPLSWVPLLRARRVVIAGDSNQLPPTLYSPEAARGGLSTTLFDRLRENLPAPLQTLLRVQYRMNETIMGFSSKEFYEGKLIADDSVKTHAITELPGVAPGPLTGRPLVFIDTAGAGYEESFNKLLQSRENAGEARLAAKVMTGLLESGIPPEDAALLTPYSAQVKMLKGLLHAPGLEIGTVDGFQGREKEATVLSLVRSNEKGTVGFLGDIRRMNVAITRARRLMIVIGDSATISRHPFYRDFLEYASARGDYRSAYEFME